MEKQPSISRLIHKYLYESLTSTEQEQLDQWVAHSEKNHLLFERLKNTGYMNGRIEEYYKLNIDLDKEWEHVMEAYHEKQKTHVMAARKKIAVYAITAIAASLVAVVIGLCWFLTHRNDHPALMTSNHASRSASADTSPPADKAILTLADHSSIVLDSSASGLLATETGTQIVKEKGNVLSVIANKEMTSAVPALNSITTQHGNQYQVVLADGSKVWLNASSSLRFPAVFTGAERDVELTGEGYFEVAHLNKGDSDPTPFIVNVGNMKVQVIGTHFNIYAYNDEKIIKTTLLQGAIRIIKNKHSYLLQPGQQALLSANDRIKIINNADLDESIAWKNNLFVFKNATIQQIMSEVARWYGVDIQYKDNVQKKLVATVPRTSSLPNLLKILELTGNAHFSLEGKTVLVMK